MVYNEQGKQIKLFSIKMNIFGIGLPEMVLILTVALLIFGPKKLPEIGRSLGKAIRGFQQASQEFETEFKREAEKLEESVKMKAQIEESKDLETNQIQDKSS
jgi:sec-independent protein translocase protein TatA